MKRGLPRPSFWTVRSETARSSGKEARSTMIARMSSKPAISLRFQLFPPCPLSVITLPFTLMLYPCFLLWMGKYGTGRFRGKRGRKEAIQPRLLLKSRMATKRGIVFLKRLYFPINKCRRQSLKLSIHIINGWNH